MRKASVFVMLRFRRTEYSRTGERNIPHRRTEYSVRLCGIFRAAPSLFRAALRLFCAALSSFCGALDLILIGSNQFRAAKERESQQEKLFLFWILSPQIFIFPWLGLHKAWNLQMNLGVTYYMKKIFPGSNSPSAKFLAEEGIWTRDLLITEPVP